MIRSFSGNESNRSLWVEEIAFPELHFTAWCWIHSSGNSFWMFHHRLDPRGWYNPLITHTRTHTHIHPQWGAFASCMWGIWESIICWGSDLIAYSMWEDTNMIECQAKQRQSPWYVRIALEVSHYHFLSRIEGSKCSLHVVTWTFLMQYLTVLTPISQLPSGLMPSHYQIELSGGTTD